MLLEVGTILEGRVSGITKFGAFIQLPGGKSGMVHISEVANAYVSDIHDYLSEGQPVRVRIIGFTPDGKINLSIKRAEAPPPQPPHPQRPQPRQPQPYQQGHRQPSQPPRQQSRRREEYSGRGPAPQMAEQRPADPSFEDKLKQFMQEADSKMSGSRLYEQQRRSRRRK